MLLKPTPMEPTDASVENVKDLMLFVAELTENVFVLLDGSG